MDERDFIGDYNVVRLKDDKLRMIVFNSDRRVVSIYEGDARCIIKVFMEEVAPKTFSLRKK